MDWKRSMAELGRMTPEEFRIADKTPLVLVLDNIRSGLNVGSIFRSADAFRVLRIYCCGITPAPPQRDVLKSALGATETVEWEHREDALALVEELMSSGFSVVAIEQTRHSTPLHNFVPGDAPMALVFGNEVKGVEEKIIGASNGALEVDQFGSKHSLNVAVCTGIVLYDLHRKLRNQ
jgi:23S rRNA (guanosine2251-2'-O)-methyltransferase